MISITVRKKKRSTYTSLYLDINYHGKRKWERLDLTLTGNKPADRGTIDAAERIRAQRLIELSSGKYDIDPFFENKNFLEFYKKMIDERPDYERRSPIYKHLTGYCKENNIKELTFGDLNEGFWNRFKNYLINTGKHSQTTIHTELYIIKAILNRAVRDKLIARNPLQNIREKRPKSTRTYLTYEELQKLNNTPCMSKAVKNAFFFSCYTGLRVSDVRNLKKLNLVNSKIVIPMKKTKDYVHVPFDSKAIKYVPNFDSLKNEDNLFSLPASSTMNIMIRQWAASAGIMKRVSYHTSRHTFATMLLTYGGTLEQAKELLGHSNVRETQIYAKLIDEKKSEAIRNLPVI